MTGPKPYPIHEPNILSRIGGAAQGGSSKPPREREALDKQHQEEQQESPEGAGQDSGKPAEPASKGTPASDDRSSSERDADMPG